MSWIERKYVSLLSNSLPKFKQKSSVLWNCRCVVCGDSKSNPNAARGYIFENKGTLVYHCHNCNISLPFSKLLKTVNILLYEQMIAEKFSLDQHTKELVPEILKVIIPHANKYLSVLKKVSQLPHNHPCKLYLLSRQIPTTYHYKLFYCPKFKSWTNAIIPDKFTIDRHDKPRLIIPLITSEGDLIGYQGRALDPEDKVRYITIMVDESKPRLYGLDSVDLNRKYYIFEGPIDSMFIVNSIATCGGSLIREMDLLDKNTENAVVVYDCEPRNPQIITNIRQAIKKGFKVCIWPHSMEDKDINQMIQRKVVGGHIKTELIAKAGLFIQNIIDCNTYSGPSAEVALNNWKRI